jgi:2-iminoacetate synthase ThiH
MNTQLFKKLQKQASDVRVSGFGATEVLDADKLVRVTVEEVIKLLKKGDPDFNNFSENLVRQHFGVR